MGLSESKTYKSGSGLHRSERQLVSPMSTSSNSHAVDESVSSLLGNEESIDTLNSASSTLQAASQSTLSDEVEATLADEATFNDLYRLENVIGSGSYASVFRCVSRKMNENFAVKVINDKLLSSYQRQLICNEEAILRSMDHRNVIKLVAVFSNEPDVKRMIFEFADQLDVCLALVTSPNFGEEAIRGAARQLFCGLAYLHEKNVVHRDLKLENLLVKSDASTGEMVMKISDFGYAVELKSGQQFFTMKNTIIGSFEYMSPELIAHQEYSTKIDCWAAGVIVYFLFTGDFPFGGANVTEMARHIVKREVTLDFNSPEWTAASHNAVDFICSILSSYNRPNAKQLLKHPWLSAPEDHPQNKTTDQPLPIMRNRERMDFLHHEAEMKHKRLYNNSSSDKTRHSRLHARSVGLQHNGCDDPAMQLRGRRHFWQASGSHEATLARELLVNSAATADRRRCRSRGA